MSLRSAYIVLTDWDGKKAVLDIGPHNGRRIVSSQWSETILRSAKVDVLGKKGVVSMVPELEFKLYIKSGDCPIKRPGALARLKDCVLRRLAGRVLP